MARYYAILGIDPQANATAVRAAYKRLAFAYHPDHNPGNPDAEELFKQVNAAYQTLSDPVKRALYDGTFFPQYAPPITSDYERTRPIRRHPVKAQPYYRIDREYFRMQVLSILVFVALAGFGFALLNGIQYAVERKQLRDHQADTREIQHAGTLFAEGHFDDAFSSIRMLTAKSPLEYRIRYAFDSLAHVLRTMADDHYNNQHFAQAATLYMILGRHEAPASVETLRKIALSQYNIGAYQESLTAMKELHKQYPDNPELVYSIALMNLDKIQNINEAMVYFEKGKSLHQKRIEDTYGFSFTNVVNPGGVAELYFDVLQGSARCNILLNKFDDAVKDCDDAAQLRPDVGDTYRLRALANARRQKMETVCRDLARARRLGSRDLEALEKEFCL